VEPYNASEDPEARATIAQWESDRADALETKHDILREALERIASWNNSDGTPWRTSSDAPTIARDALLRAGKGEEQKDAS
jgi:hypothetical protein